MALQDFVLPLVLVLLSITEGCLTKKRSGRFVSTTIPPFCNEMRDPAIGHITLAFICGLNDQWHPNAYDGGEIIEEPRCSPKGSIVGARCPLICTQGQYMPAPCPRFCEVYPNNHCEMYCPRDPTAGESMGNSECGADLCIEYGCDPFNPPNKTTIPPWPTTPKP